MQVRQQEWAGWEGKWEDEKGSYSCWKKHEKDKGMNDKIYKKHWRDPRHHWAAWLIKAFTSELLSSGRSAPIL